MFCPGESFMDVGEDGSAGFQRSFGWVFSGRNRRVKTLLPPSPCWKIRIITQFLVYSRIHMASNSVVVGYLGSCHPIMLLKLASTSLWGDENQNKRTSLFLGWSLISELLKQELISLRAILPPSCLGSPLCSVIMTSPPAMLRSSSWVQINWVMSN